MYNKSIQLHTSAEQNITSGYYHTVGVCTKETLEMSSEMYTHTSLLDINAHVTITLLWSQRVRRQPSFLVRIDDDERENCSGKKEYIC